MFFRFIRLQFFKLPLQPLPCLPFNCRLVTFHLLSTLRLLSWLHWMKIWGVTGNRLEEATKYPTFLLQQAGKFCCVHVSLGQHHTPKLYLSGSSACWWGRSSGWQGPSLQTLPSSKTKCLSHSFSPETTFHLPMIIYTLRPELEEQ